MATSSRHYFCIGVGGIGVSGLSQLLVHQGHQVAGSDRGLHDHGKEELYASLQKQGIRLYPQDGSGPTAEKPDALVISTAVEDGNPDLLASPGIPVIHRATALAQAIDAIPAIQIAVAGSCGKTSVTGWIATALRALGKRVLMVNGGYSLDAESDVFPGNFYADDNPEFVVVEVDESDRSLTAFHPDYGVLLNVGNDHYGQDELEAVFSTFLGQCKRGVVTLNRLKGLAHHVEGRAAATFDDHPQDDPSAISPSAFSHTPEGISFAVPGLGAISSCQTGFHSAVNACAVLALLKLLPLGASSEQLCQAIACFHGIRQRFEVIGTHPSGAVIVNDYAHNPEKLSAAISAARGRFSSPLTAIFQPHGFKPLRFMRDVLVETLSSVLTPEDLFIMLPVFYAGGTTIPSPTSEEVVEQLKSAGINALSADRAQAEACVRQRHQTCILIMGARDPSLRTWSQDISQR